MNQIRPPHYHDLFPEPALVFRAWNLTSNLSMASKYIVRAGQKPGEDAITAIGKAIEFLQIELTYLSRMEMVESGEIEIADLLARRDEVLDDEEVEAEREAYLEGLADAVGKHMAEAADAELLRAMSQISPKALESMSKAAAAEGATAIAGHLATLANELGVAVPPAPEQTDNPRLDAAQAIGLMVEEMMHKRVEEEPVPSGEEFAEPTMGDEQFLTHMLIACRTGITVKAGQIERLYNLAGAPHFAAPRPDWEGTINREVGESVVGQARKLLGEKAAAEATQAA